MKIAASIFSWLGGLLTTIVGFVYVAGGFNSMFYYCDGYSCSTGTLHQESPAWLWVLLIAFAIFRLIILIWRQRATNHGKKVGCGVCTLLFVSTIGGILTLCIPEIDLW